MRPSCPPHLELPVVDVHQGPPHLDVELLLLRQEGLGGLGRGHRPGETGPPRGKNSPSGQTSADLGILVLWSKIVGICRGLSGFFAHWKWDPGHITDGFGPRQNSPGEGTFSTWRRALGTQTPAKKKYPGSTFWVDSLLIIPRGGLIFWGDLIHFLVANPRCVTTPLDHSVFFTN